MSNHFSAANLKFSGDMVALMDALGHQRFAMYGIDTGMPIAYALAADHPDRLDRLVVSFDKP
jgi:pimeloyl-ACP methyl ester carboxylesterase